MATPLAVYAEAGKRWRCVLTIHFFALIQSARVENLLERLTINKLCHNSDQMYGQMEFGLNLSLTYSEANFKKPRQANTFICIG